MTMESRSIDIAKTASIDLMGLNNKVVNMREVVRRTKVQVINKLCRNIEELKKKKGTEEQKAKNLSKAERYLEEIDSIKKLKDDKVSKYALANTRTFSDVCKESQLAGQRALGRLADHPLMKKLVSDFRAQHSDWQDLAAFLLVKQTGRRFKTKKQKQKKLSKCVENMNASETMTKVYIQERFGKEGLEKAEKKFESRKKKSKQATEESPTDKPETKNISESSKDKDNIVPISSTTLVKVLPDLDGKLDSIEIFEVSNSDLEPPKSKPDKNNHSLKPKVKDQLETSAPDEITLSQEFDTIRNIKTVQSDLKSVFSKKDENSSVSKFLTENTLIKKPMQEKQGKPEEGDSSGDSSSSKAENDSASSHSENDSSHSESENDSSGSDSEIDLSDLKSQNDLSSSESESDSSGSDSEIDLSDLKSQNDLSSSESESDSSGSELEDDKEGTEKRQKSNSTKKKTKKKKEHIPEFLLKAYAKPINDPFFGSDDDNDNVPIRYEDNELLDDNDIGNDDMSFKKGKIESMFYNPEIKSSKKGKKLKGPGRFNKKDGRVNFDNERRPSSFKNSNIKSPVAPQKNNFNKRHSLGEKPVGKSRKFAREFTATKNVLSNNLRNTDKPLNAKKVVTVKSEKLHPSWEASRKRKAEQAGITEFKGKKITFNDDD